MKECFKILDQPMDPEELWGPREPSNHWDTGDVIEILVFLGIVILVCVLCWLYKFIPAYIYERRRMKRLEEFRKERGIAEWCKRRQETQ